MSDPITRLGVIRQQLKDIEEDKRSSLLDRRRDTKILTKDAERVEKEIDKYILAFNNKWKMIENEFKTVMKITSNTVQELDVKILQAINEPIIMQRGARARQEKNILELRADRDKNKRLMTEKEKKLEEDRIKYLKEKAKLKARIMENCPEFLPKIDDPIPKMDIPHVLPVPIVKNTPKTIKKKIKKVVNELVYELISYGILVILLLLLLLYLL